jgi:4-carboxymuconolactone decarboxylase
MQIMRSGSQASVQGPSDWFTGSVRIDPLVNAEEPSRVQAGSVSFEPGARSAWHTHPLGQTLIVTFGCGLIQQWGKPVEIIRAGDVIWTPPGTKHWHGATSQTGMTHIAITEKLNGKNVDWLEQVSEQEYQAGCAACREQQHEKNGGGGGTSSVLDKYENSALKDLWKRTELSARDRSLVTLAVLIARNQSTELGHYVDSALDNGVAAAEISECIAHLAFYSGWANAKSAGSVVQSVFTRRSIASDQLPQASPSLLPLNEDAESKRAANVEAQFGQIAPGLVQYTTDVLFRDLWLRPDLKPRDRSLITISALMANGHTGQIPYHLNRAMDNGLTKSEAGEVVTQVAFYAGWPSAFSAVPIVKDVFEKRQQS